MWSQAGALPLLLLLLLLACCCCRTAAQRQSIWDEPIRFSTRAKDSCTMTVTGQGELTRLRLSCQSNKRSYWCEYVGKPYLCRVYSKNPRHYFVQMMWGLKKLYNACQAPRAIKPHMCRKATDDAQMVFSRSWPETLEAEAEAGAGAGAVRPVRPQPGRPQPGRPQPGRPHPGRPQPGRPHPGRPQLRPAPAGPDAARQAPKKSIRIPEQETSSPQPPSEPPTAPSVESNPKRIARQYCWRSLQGLCSFFIGFVRH